VTVCFGWFSADQPVAAAFGKTVKYVSFTVFALYRSSTDMRTTKNSVQIPE